jgi:hypothetical protein
MDGHSIHITSIVIVFCMDNDIDLLILPPHCSHLLQPLDVGVYGLLKKHHAQEVDRYARAGIQRIQRDEWVALFQHIREKASTRQNILSGWSASGLLPYHPQRVLKYLPLPARQSTASLPQVPSSTEDLDFSVLTNSPSDGTELKHANTVFVAALASPSCPTSPIRWYAKRMTKLVESQNAELAILRKELQAYKELNQTRKKYTKASESSCRAILCSAPRKYWELSGRRKQTQRGNSLVAGHGSVQMRRSRM